MIRINNISLPLNYSEALIQKIACKHLQIENKAISSCSIYRKSIDARKKENIKFIVALDIKLNVNEEKIVRHCKTACIVKEEKYIVPKWNKTTSPLIVGMGPAGLFAGLILAQSGAKPIIIERGCDVDTRTNDVNNFWKTGVLNTNSNVQFGEGGAGTFSDGKLNTGTKDNRQRKVLEEFVKHNAPKDILINAKPHIGTDKLKDTVKNIRKTIISLGGKVIFNAKLIDIVSNNNHITKAVIEKDGKKDFIETDNIILAVGHSARDTFEMLQNKCIAMEQKNFSVGARIEHLQSNIDKAQYGKFAGNKALGASSYKMNTHLSNGRGVYTFCMCPGGSVVNASSENNMLVTNGMSKYNRDEPNSNSALLVGVGPKDFKSDDVLAGMYYQRMLESKAFVLGGSNFNVPVQRVDDFLNKKATTHLGEVLPSVKPNYTFSNLFDIFPKEIAFSMQNGIIEMNKKLKGFANGDALLTGVETRSSSPVRIIRDSTMQSVSVKGLYPCGEGAGYAGGIISAAVDGIKCAEFIINKD